MKPTLVIGDIHAPYTHRSYLAHCQRVYREWGCGHVVIIGDEIDAHALSDHDHDPDLPSSGDELKAAIRGLKPWYRAFPKAKVCIGNHTARWYRKAYKHGIPRAVIKDYREVLGAPKGWVWDMRFVLDGVLYIHGSTSGRMAVINRALREGMSTVHGHTHCHGGVLYQRSRRRMVFALNVGCGIDEEARAFAYAADTPDRPTLGCGVVINRSEAHFIPLT